MSAHLKIVLAATLVFNLGVFISYVHFERTTQNDFYSTYVESAKAGKAKAAPRRGGTVVQGSDY